MKPRYVITEANKKIQQGEAVITLTPDEYTEEELLKAINVELERRKTGLVIMRI